MPIVQSSSHSVSDPPSHIPLTPHVEVFTLQMAVQRKEEMEKSGLSCGEETESGLCLVSSLIDLWWSLLFLPLLVPCSQAMQLAAW
eukprot:753713-Hanusia_phi.AAC.3